MAHIAWLELKAGPPILVPANNGFSSATTKNGYEHGFAGLKRDLRPNSTTGIRELRDGDVDNLLVCPYNIATHLH